MGRFWQFRLWLADATGRYSCPDTNLVFLLRLRVYFIHLLRRFIVRFLLFINGRNRKSVCIWWWIG